MFIILLLYKTVTIRYTIRIHIVMGRGRPSIKYHLPTEKKNIFMIFLPGYQNF